MITAASDGEVEIPETFNVTVGDSSLPDGITIPSPLTITIKSLDRKLDIIAKTWKEGQNVTSSRVMVTVRLGVNRNSSERNRMHKC